MITQEQQKQGAELMKTLVEKAWESATFKDQLVENPIATIESVTGNKIQDNVKFVVDDQTDGSVVYLNIPAKINLEDFELTNDQLEMLSGGDSLPYDLGYAWMTHTLYTIKAGATLVAAGANYVANSIH